MAAAAKIEVKDKALKPFFDRNPDFDILHFDFHNKEGGGKSGTVKKVKENE